MVVFLSMGANVCVCGREGAKGLYVRGLISWTVTKLGTQSTVAMETVLSCRGVEMCLGVKMGQSLAFLPTF